MTTVRSESNPPVFGAERDRVKALAAIDHLALARDAASVGLRNTRAKRARLVALLDQQVAAAEVAFVEAQDRLDEARRRAAALKET